MAQPKDSTSDNAVNSAVNGTVNGTATDAANGAANGSANGAGAENSLPSQLAGMLDDHKGKLAIGVAATLGLMVFYSWREKRLAKEDPEAHALHQRSKAIVKAAETEAGRRHDDAPGTQSALHSRGGEKDALSR
jgi:hypothetical protein